MEIECKIISNSSKRTRLQGTVLCTVQTELPRIFCTLNIKVIPTEGHSSICRLTEPQEMFHLEHTDCTARKLPSSHQILVGQEGSQRQTLQEYLQSTGHPSLTSQGSAWHCKSVLTICRFRVVTFAYLLKFSVIPEWRLVAHPRPLPDTHAGSSDKSE